jgi:hypothetical protein
LARCLFLWERAFPIETAGNDFAFQRGDYGPLSSGIRKDVEFLEEQGRARIRIVPKGKYEEYSATREGLARSRGLSRRVYRPALVYLRKVAAWAEKLDFMRLCHAVREIAPEFHEGSLLA